MKDQDKTKDELSEELAEMRRRVASLEGIDAERQRAEEALRQSEGRYRALAECARDIIFILDRQGTLAYANQAASQCIGIPLGDIVGKRQVDLFPPEMARSQIEKIGRVFASGEVIEYDDLFHFGPAEVWLRIHLIPIRAEARQITSVMGVCHNITERKRAEEALQKAHDELEQRVEERTAELAKANESLDIFRRFAEASGEGFGMSDFDGRIVYANPTLCRLFGEEKPEDVVGKNVSTYYPGEYLRSRKDEILPALLREGHRHIEQTVLPRQGKPISTRQSTFLIRDENGNPFRVAVVISDITERKAGEDALRASEERFRVTFEEAPVGMAICVEDGVIAKANRALCRISGYTQEELIGRHVRDLAHPEDRETSGPFVKKLLAGEIPSFTLEKRYLRKDGQPFWAQATTAAAHGPDGKIAFALGVVEDIDDRKRAEEDLRQSERRFRNYFEQGLIGMAVTSVDKRWLEVNDRLCQILGYSREELFQKTWEELTYPDDLQPNLQLFNPLLAGEIEHFTLNKRYLKKDGSVVHATIHTRAFRNEDGTIGHIVTLIEDITARKQAEEALERERQSLWRMLQASDHERQIISYEIHDGLAQYLAAAGMQFQAYDSLRENLPVEAKRAYETALELVRQAHAESRRLINEVRPPVIDETGIETAISHLVHEQRRHGGPKIKFDSDVQFGKLLPILENALYRIAQEALTNACKHSKSKKVTVTLAQDGQDVRLEVRDWGIGFDTESIKEGHFGLESIRQRARLLGGRVTIETKPGFGTLVQAVVPIVERQNEE